MRTAVENQQPMSAEKLFDVLKKEFADYINSKLDSEVNIEFNHVDNEINVLFPDVTSTALTISVSEEEIAISYNAVAAEYNVDLLARYLIEFIKIKAE